MKFAEKLKMIMRERKLTQLALSKMIGMRQSQVHSWVMGKTLPSYFALKALHEKLEISVAEFFDLG
jgi:transcriptional regulator with XRE-family HTH domain